MSKIIKVVGNLTNNDENSFAYFLRHSLYEYNNSLRLPVHQLSLNSQPVKMHIDDVRCLLVGRSQYSTAAHGH